LVPALAALALAGCEDVQGDSTPPTPRVKVFTVGKEATGQSRRISGKVEAAETTTLSFGVSGQVLEVPVSTGQFVVAGALLAQMDPEPFQLALKEARARVTSARARLVDARSAYDRTSALVAEQAAAQKDLDAATAAMAQADSEVKAAQGAQKKAELDLGRTRLTAPFDGRLVSVAVDPFQDISANGEAVLMQSEGALDVAVLVPETMIRNVDYGQVVEIGFPTLEGVSVSGTVRSIGAQVEAGNAYAVKVRVEATEADVRPGMTASVTFSFASGRGEGTAYLIPLSALAIEAGILALARSGEEVREQRRAPVFVLDPGTGTLQLRKLEIGDLKGNEVEVFKGLAPGELVVSAGTAFLRDGMAAEVWVQRR